MTEAIFTSSWASARTVRSVQQGSEAQEPCAVGHPPSARRGAEAGATAGRRDRPPRWRRRQKRRRIPEAQAAGEQFWEGEFGEFLFKQGEFLAPLPEYHLERMWEERLEWHQETMRMEDEDIQYEAASESESGGERI